MTDFGRWVYTLILLGSLVAASLLVRQRQSKLLLSMPERWAIRLSAFLGAMLGAKLPFVMSSGWEAFYSGSAWFMDGKTILGGIFGGYLAVEFAKWIFQIRVKTGDSFALPIAIAVGVGRIGCFMAGCCFGNVTEVPWGIHFETASDPPEVLRHPTQLYEVAFHWIAAVVLLVAAKRRWVEGNQLKAYLIVYLAFRFFTEWLRPESVILLNLTSYQIASALLMTVLIVLWRWDRNLVSQQEPTLEPLHNDLHKPLTDEE